MNQPLASEPTSFTLDNMGRFLCNTLQEARDSAAQTLAGRQRDFDLIVIGGEVEAAFHIKECLGKSAKLIKSLGAIHVVQPPHGTVAI